MSVFAMCDSPKEWHVYVAIVRNLSDHAVHGVLWFRAFAFAFSLNIVVGGPLDKWGILEGHSLQRS